LITALKPYLGHNLGSCCLLEITILMMALRNNFIPPTLNVEEVDPKLNINLTVTPREGQFKTIMKTACGFAGYNGAGIFTKVVNN